MRHEPKFIESPRIYFRAVTMADAEGNYLRWMNDPEVTQFLESRFKPQSVESIQAYIADVSDSKDNIFCAIVQKSDHRHIGNIRLGPIDWIHRRAEVGILIGEKDCWGHGLGTEAYKMMTEHAFFSLNLNKVTAGAYEENAGSRHALIRAGFVEEGRRRSHCFVDGTYVDVFVYGALREEFVRQELIEEALEQTATKTKH